MKKLTYLLFVVLLLGACGSGGTEPTEPVDTATPVTDLVVIIEERSGDPIFKNDPFTYYINVKNNGIDKAKGVKLIVTLPFEITDVPKQCNISGLTLECNLDTIETGFSKGVLVFGIASEAGTFAVSAAVSASTKDSNPSNNTTKENLKVMEVGSTPQPIADLQVKLEEQSENPLPKENLFAYSAVVRNNGSSVAEAAKLTLTVPFPVTEVPTGCSSANLTLECKLGDLKVGMSRTVIVSGKATNTGISSVSAEVSATTYDPDSSNDSASRSFEVFEPTTPQPPEPGDKPTPTTPDLRGQIASWNVGATTLATIFYGTGGAQAEVATGNIGADGKLEIFLNKTVSNDFLTPLGACAGLTQSNAAARQNTFSAMSVLQNQKVVGRVALASKAAVLSDGLQAVGDYYVQQTYADAATTLQGSCKLGGAVDAVFKYDVKLNRGWNAVTFKLAAKNGGAQTVELSSGTPQGAAWYFEPAP